MPRRARTAAPRNFRRLPSVAFLGSLQPEGLDCRPPCPVSLLNTCGERHRAVGGAGNRHSLRRRARHKCRNLLPPLWAATMMAGKTEIGVPTTGDRDCIASDRFPPVWRLDCCRANGTKAFCPDDCSTSNNARLAASSNSMGNCRTRIDNCFNFDTVRAKIARGAPAVIVVGEDDDAVSRRYRKAIGVSPNGGGHHNAGTVVPTENDPAFDCTRSEHRAFRHDSPQPLPGMIRLRHRSMIGYALKRAIDAIVIATKHRRPRHQPNVRYDP